MSEKFGEDRALCIIMKNNRKPELLCPAGKWDALVAAVQNGADAVYLGEKSFSARKNASNFSWDEIKEAVKYCHLRDVKVHLALNTLISDSELRGFEESVINAADAGVDALIIQDIGGAKLAHTVCPEMELHASTQLTACNEYDVETLSNHGFSRIVLSRELSKQEIEHIYRNTDAELEAFVHGALCICFSGKCLMSSFIGGRSGNRGECAQPCRQLYNYDRRKGYFLSPRDLCLADEVKAMYEAGITSFKIEGRMKSPEYVATVASVYRKYLDSFTPFDKSDEEKLKKIFVRGDGFTKAYFAEKNTPDIMNYSISNDNLSSRADEEVLKEARQSYREGIENKKVSVDALLTVKANNPASLVLTDGKNTVCVKGALGEIAKKLPLSEERARAQIAKLGNTPFSLGKFEFFTDGLSTATVSVLNSLRRDASELLSLERMKIHKKCIHEFSYPQRHSGKSAGKPYLVAEISSLSQFNSCQSADRILVPIHLWKSISPNDKCFVVLPEVVIDAQALKKQLENIPVSYGVYASSPGMMSLAKSLGHKVYADWGANIYNSISVLSLSEFTDGITLSPELSLSVMKDIVTVAPLPVEAVCYGYQCVMTSRACLIRGITGKCDCTKPVTLKDKTGAEFLITGNEETHLNSVYNSRPTFMADKIKDIIKSGISGMRLCFTVESADETKRIIDMYQGKIPVEKPSFYTRGYLLK